MIILTIIIYLGLALLHIFVCVFPWIDALVDSEVDLVQDNTISRNTISLAKLDDITNNEVFDQNRVGCAICTSEHSDRLVIDLIL